MPRAMLFTGPGQPLEVVQYRTPEPRGAEVLVRIACCTLCRSDLHTHAGRRAEPTPTVLGHEIVGRIETFGPQAPRHDAQGQPVARGSRITWAMVVGCGSCFYCAEGLPQKCVQPFKYGHQRVERDRPLTGGLADYLILVPGTYFMKVPDEIPDPVAAPANCATATVAALLRLGGPVAHRAVLVLGAGVLGLTACAMARSAGARAVLACDPVPECRQRALAFGATQTFAPTGKTDLVAEMAAATQGRGADVVFELAGTAESVTTGLDLVRTGGTMVLAGTVAPVGVVPLNPEMLVRRMLTLRGVHNYHPRDLVAALVFLAGPGQGFPWHDLVAADYSLEQADQAFAHAHRQPGMRVAVLPDRRPAD